MFFIPPIFSKTKIKTLSYITAVSQSNGGANITLMNGINAGDLLVWCDWALSASVIPSDTGGSGWTKIGTQSHAGVDYGSRVTAWYKIAIGDEDSTSVTGLQDVTSDKKIVMQFRANKPIKSLSASGWVATITDGDPAQQTIAAASGTAPVLGVTAFRTSSGLSGVTTSITPDQEYDIGSVNSAIVHRYTQNLNPQNYTFDMVDSGDSNGLAGFYIHNFR